MLTVQTKYIGDVTVDQNKIITFPSGLPGFKHETKFILHPLSSIPAEVFQTLQSVNTPHLAFVVANPYHFYRDYEFRLNEPARKHLQIRSEERRVGKECKTRGSPTGVNKKVYEEIEAR